MDGLNNWVTTLSGVVSNNIAKLSAQEQQIQILVNEVKKMREELAGIESKNKVCIEKQSAMEANFKIETSKLQKQLDVTKTLQQTQRAESDIEIRQLKASVLELTLANRNLMELVTKLTSHINILEKSNSFFASSQAPSEVGDDDRSGIEEELSKALSEANVNDQ